MPETETGSCGSTRPLLRCAALRLLEAEHHAAEPSLMERAGCAAAERAARLATGAGGEILVLVGPGNNGGDGFVVARELLRRGYRVTVASPGSSRDLPPDAAHAKALWEAAGGQIVADFDENTGWAMAIDALFGIGLSRPLEGIWAQWIDRFNALSCPRLALDIPSGLNADTGLRTGPCIQATHTATFIALKPGLLTFDGPDACGEIDLFDLGIGAVQSAGHELSMACFGHCLQPRRHNVHKGSFGSAGIIGGSAGMQGAALMASRAALHLGPGKVFLGLLASDSGVDAMFPEVMWRHPEDVCRLVNALAIGPGLGQTEMSHAVLQNALGFHGPLLVDADGLNLLAGDSRLAGMMAMRDRPGVITPHPAEAARLLHCTVADVQHDRVESALDLAARLRSIVVLKGCGSIVAVPDGRWFINPTGHGGMATGGMGDVLSGLLVGLLAQGWPVLEAVLCSVYLHGAAADALACDGAGPVGLTASEIMPVARRLFNRWIKDRQISCQSARQSIGIP